ncbi:MAG: TRAP transporter permease [Deltaproteobacteria bacterium]|jgi:TRAP transporter 4TM/12TM fusion protein|nr:TRAP transporter permease [Deltaproteobacteria bacterium]
MPSEHDLAPKENNNLETDQGEALAVQRKLVAFPATFVYIAGVIMSLAHVWFNSFGVISELQRNASHYAMVLLLGFVFYPMSKKYPDKTLKADFILAVLGFVVGFYLIFFEDALHARNEVPIVRDLIFAGMAIVLLIELTRRCTGYLIPFLAIFCLSYVTFLGPHFSGLLQFRGVTVERLLYRMYFAPDGIFGTIASISSTYVFLFILFGAFLLRSGAGDFVLKLAMAVMGRTIGGPAKMAVVASGLMGSISGSAVANTVGTGSLTIPLMKQTGFRPYFAAAVEAAASTGGQLMPPIMGAGAFIMAEWTQIPYLKIIGVAIIPALMYFSSVIFFVHLRARRNNLEVPADTEIPKVCAVLKEGWHFLIPIGLLVGLLMYGFTPTYSASISTIAVVVASWFRKETRMGIKDIGDALFLGAKNMVSTAVVLLCAGIIVGVVLMTGMGTTFSIVALDLSGGHLIVMIVLVALASLILGMGLPVTASYIVLAVLVAPAMQMMGISLIAAHMLIFWYSQDANVTPPVCLAAYTAAGIAGSKPLQTGMEAWKLAKGIYLIPLLFCYTPILFEGPLWMVLEATASGLVGLFSFAILFEGFFFRLAVWPVRIGYGLITVFMFWPGWQTNLFGFGLFLIFGLWQWWGKHRSANKYVTNAEG